MSARSLLPCSRRTVTGSTRSSYKEEGSQCAATTDAKRKASSSAQKSATTHQGERAEGESEPGQAQAGEEGCIQTSVHRQST